MQCNDKIFRCSYCHVLKCNNEVKSLIDISKMLNLSALHSHISIKKKSLGYFFMMQMTILQESYSWWKGIIMNFKHFQHNSKSSPSVEAYRWLPVPRTPLYLFQRQRT